MSRLAIRALAHCALLVGGGSATFAQSVFVDFGDSGQPTAGNYNNIVVNPPGTLTIPNAIDSTGAGTGIGVSVSGFFNGSNTNGTTAPTGDAAAFDAQATRDNGFGHAAAFGANPLTPVGTVSFSGLNPGLLYDFTFFGSRTGVSDNRETEYNVSGANAGSAFLNTANNTSDVATVTGIAPTAGGEITLLVDPGPNNTSTSQFWYIGAMRLTAVPEPAGAGVVLAGAAIACVRRRRR